jgi:hypothetical protein
MALKAELYFTAIGFVQKFEVGEIIKIGVGR